MGILGISQVLGMALWISGYLCGSALLGDRDIPLIRLVLHSELCLPPRLQSHAYYCGSAENNRSLPILELGLCGGRAWLLFSPPHLAGERLGVQRFDARGGCTWEPRPHNLNYFNL